MKSIDKKQKLDLLKADAQRLLSTDLVKIKGGTTAPKAEAAFCVICASCYKGQ